VRKPDHVVWIWGSPETAVATTGTLHRWWHQFRLGWYLGPPFVRQTCTARPVDRDPVELARWWETALPLRR